MLIYLNCKAAPIRYNARQVKDLYGKFFKSHFLLVFLALLAVTACREQSTPTPTPQLTPTPVAALVLTPTVQPAATTCASDQRVGWELYQLQAGDTLSQLAEARQIGTERIMAANCLTTTALIEGASLYLPPLPTPTPCNPNPQSGWMPYTVRQGDTLYSLAAERPGGNVESIAGANCLKPDDVIYIGDLLYLPPLPTPTPTATSTPTPTPLPPPVIPIQPLPTIVVFNPTPAASLAPDQNLANPPGGPNPVNSAPALANPTSPGHPPPGAELTLPGFVERLIASRPGDENSMATCPLSQGQSPCSDLQPDDDPELQFAFGDYKIEIGDRLYLYACNIITPTQIISVSIIRADSSPLFTEIPLTPHDNMPHYDLREVKGATYLTWPVLPGISIDKYRVRLVTDDSIEPISSREIEVKEATQSKILVIPTGRNSDTDPTYYTYQVYYINFPSGVTHRFGLYRETMTNSLRLPADADSPDDMVERKLNKVDEWPVPIPAGQTWITRPITITMNEWLNVAHAIVYEGEEPPNDKITHENPCACQPDPPPGEDTKTTPKNPECRRPEWFFWPAELNKEAIP